MLSHLVNQTNCGCKPKANTVMVCLNKNYIFKACFVELSQDISVPERH